MEVLAYLDTHLVVWLYAGKTKLLPAKTSECLANYELLISPIVELELQYLYEVQRISQKSNKIITTLKEEIGLKICELDFSDVIKKAMFLDWTRDPFDRIITAQASIRNSRLLTKDENILKNYKYALWE